MPVLSPHRSSASALGGSYRSTFSSSTIDRPYFSSASYSPRIASYSERYSSRSYTDADGRRVFSRSGSVTEDGITSRFREDSREGSTRREPSMTRDSSASRLSVIDSMAELRNKYSPANYVPACLRERNDNAAALLPRCRSIGSDIGRPPAGGEPKRKVNGAAPASANLNNSSLLTGATNPCDNTAADANGNCRTASVAELRRKFDTAVPELSHCYELSNGCGTKSDVSEEGAARRGGTRTNNFASYIPARDFDKEASKEEPVLLEDGDSASGRRFSDISSSPKLSTTSSSSSRSAISPSTSTITPASSSNSLSRRSSDRDGGYGYNEAPHTKTLGLNGLKNIGNTCFMNSVIQCLSNTRPLLEYLQKDQHVKDLNTSTSGMKGALIRAFAETIKELWSEDAADRVVNTASLKNQIQRFAPRFIGYAQQDAQEFLRYFLEGLHEDVNRVVERPRPIVQEIDEALSDAAKAAESWSRYLRMDNSKIVDCFVGQLKSTLRCTHCGHCSVTFDPFWDLSLPVPQRAGQVRLGQCLDSFTREETLDGDEKPTCAKCKERRKCTKSLSIQKFPKILVIHLKRFSLAERFRGKLSVTVDFPLEGLDMSQYSADHVSSCRYNLYAISNHSGTTYSGHYTAYCRHPYTKTWHEYNDSRVSSISSKSTVSGEAYVLFYEQDGQRSHL